jgi:predicted nucleic acid-binding protein
VIVIDASAAVDLIVGGPAHDRVAAQLRRARTCAAPHLIDAEVGQVLRRFALAGRLDPVQATEALADFAALPLVRYAHAPLMARAFDLRANATFYDALYIVLAEALGAPLLTLDARLGQLRGHAARIEILSAKA